MSVRVLEEREGGTYSSKEKIEHLETGTSGGGRKMTNEFLTEFGHALVDASPPTPRHPAYPVILASA